MRRDGPRLLACIGDARDLHAWSGIPYFFLRAALRQGVLDDGLALRPSRLRLHKLAWCAWTALRTGRPAGFQYSPLFLERLRAQAHVPPDAPATFVTHFPLFPPRAPGSPWVVVPYVDATLRQNFDDYGQARRLSARVMADALARERDVYQAAPAVACMSTWAADDVAATYGVPRERCHVVLPGANLDEDRLTAAVDDPPPLERGLRLGFVGKDWRRKGLPLLLAAADALARRGVACEVWAAGPRPDELPAHPRLRPAGFIDKHRDMPGFLAFVRACHFGALLSSVEALGISTLEFLRLGVPALGARVGGIVDALPPDLGHLVPAGATPDDVADVLEPYARAPEAYAALRARVVAAAPRFTWARTAAAFAAILGPRS